MRTESNKQRRNTSLLLTHKQGVKMNINKKMKFAPILPPASVGDLKRRKRKRQAKCEVPKIVMNSIPKTRSITAGTFDSGKVFGSIRKIDDNNQRQAKIIHSLDKPGKFELLIRSGENRDWLPFSFYEYYHHAEEVLDDLIKQKFEPLYDDLPRGFDDKKGNTLGNPNYQPLPKNFFDDKKDYF